MTTSEVAAPRRIVQPAPDRILTGRQERIVAALHHNAPINGSPFADDLHVAYQHIALFFDDMAEAIANLSIPNRKPAGDYIRIFGKYFTDITQAQDDTGSGPTPSQFACPNIYHPNDHQKRITPYRIAAIAVDATLSVEDKNSSYRYYLPHFEKLFRKVNEWFEAKQADLAPPLLAKQNDKPFILPDGTQSRHGGPHPAALVHAGGTAHTIDG